MEDGSAALRAALGGPPGGALLPSARSPVWRVAGRQLWVALSAHGLSQRIRSPTSLWCVTAGMTCEAGLVLACVERHELHEACQAAWLQQTACCITGKVVHSGQSLCRLSFTHAGRACMPAERGMCWRARRDGCAMTCRARGSSDSVLGNGRPGRGSVGRHCAPARSQRVEQFTAL